MNQKSLFSALCFTGPLAFWLAFPSPVSAQTVPSAVPPSADVGRFKPEKNLPAPDHADSGEILTSPVLPAAPAPENAKAIHLILKDVQIVGASAFPPDELRDIYAASIGKDITLDTAYNWAAAITQRYRDAGYFLSLAYVPEQRIKNGTIVIKVVEGYIGRVELDEPARHYTVIQRHIDHLLAERPLTSKTVESTLLRLNDLPGYSFSGVLSSLADAEEGAVKLTLVPATKKGNGSITFDNFSSRFLGPNELSASYSKNLLPLQQTTISGLTSLPTNKINYLTLKHSAALTPDLTLDVTGSKTKANPGFDLEQFDIESDSLFLDATLNYQWIRQRHENLALSLTMDGRNSSTDLLDAPFTRDRIRAVRANATYDVTDQWKGYSIASLTVSQGIDGLGSSSAGDTNLSRSQATPDFTKAELSLTRLQGITDEWSLLMAASAQRASGPLYSAEEFGYGGPAFGRAFDASEITGDHGVSASLELRYAAIDLNVAQISPYFFYDIGAVWNDDIAQSSKESGTSAGLGIRATSAMGLSANLGLAWPLTRRAETPIYGQENDEPRIILQITSQF